MQSWTTIGIGLMMTPAAWAVPSFQGVGDLPGGQYYSDATAVSSDGTVVVGQSSAAAGAVAYRWTAAGGMESLGDLPGGTVSSVAFDVSPDGNAATGWSFVGTNQREAFVWVKDVGMQGLGDLPGGSYFSSGRGVTNGGTTVIGSASNTMGWEAMRWTKGGGLQGLGDMGGDNNTTVLATSPNCDFYVGFGTTSNGSEAYVAALGGSKRPLGDLPGGTFHSTASGVSPDGSIVVGNSRSASGTEAFVWTAAGGMKGLGDLPGGQFGSYAYGVSADGKVVVGMATSDKGFRAVMWSETGTITDLNTFLADQGVALGGWVLEAAVAVTPDGRTIIGTGTNPQLQSEGWILRLGAEPDPFTPVWGDSQDFGAGWRHSAWYGWFNRDWYPLMWHQEHGWQVCHAASAASVMFYDHGLSAWVWTSQATYPFFYQYGSDPGWLYYLRDSLPGHRWFFHYAHNAYFNEESL